MLADLWKFTVTVVGYWQAYATGGVVTAVIGLIEKLSGRMLSKTAYVNVFIVAYLLTAFFLAWRDEHRELTKARSESANLKAASDSMAARLEQAEAQVRDLTARLAASISGTYTPSLDLVYAEKQFRFYNRGKSNVYLWGTQLGDSSRDISKEPRVITPAGSGLVGQGFYYIIGDVFERFVKARIGNDGEARVPLDVFVATEASKRYRIRYELWIVVAGGNLTVHPQNIGMVELDWSKL